MKRTASSIFLVGVVTCSLFSGALFRGGLSGITGSVHAQEQEKVDNGACSVASVNGAYGFFRTGDVPAGPLAAVGIATFDGKGSSTARQTTRRFGVTTSDLFTTPAAPGTYEVDPDCAGRGFLPDGSVFVHFVVVDGGKELFILSLSDSNTVYGVMKKISSRRDRED
jgi:hypothetical protein